MRCARKLLLLIAVACVGCGDSIPGSYEAKMDVPTIAGEPMIEGFDGSMQLEMRGDKTFTVTMMGDSLNGTWKRNGDKIEMTEPKSPGKVDTLTIQEDGSLTFDGDVGFPAESGIVFRKVESRSQ